MSIRFWSQKRRHAEKPPKSPETPPADRSGKRPETFDERLEWVRHELVHCSDLIIHTFHTGKDRRCALVFFRGMIDKNTVQDELLRDLLSLEAEDAQRFNEQLFEQKRLSVTGMSVVTDMDQGLAAVLDGHALLFVDGDPRMLDIPCSSIEKRAIEEAPNESVIRGPRESFIEDLDVNIRLLRKRLKTPSFMDPVDPVRLSGCFVDAAFHLYRRHVVSPGDHSFESAYIDRGLQGDRSLSGAC